MDESTYQLEEAVLCGRYGIVGYHPDTDCDSTGATSTDNPIDVLPNVQDVK